MVLLKLRLRMFKGVKSFELIPEGQSVDIFGANGQGKSTTAIAYTWLLFNKGLDNESAAKFGIKTRDDKGNHLHGEEHSAEAHFRLKDGREIRLKKVFKEIWRRKDNSFQGHTTDYYWNEEALKESEYQCRIEEILTEDQFAMITTPTHFASLDWKVVLKVLIDIAGNIADEEVIAKYPELAEYLKIIDGRNQDSVVNILKSRRANSIKSIDSIPARIDENNLKIKSPEVDLKEADVFVLQIKEIISKENEELQSFKSGGAISELKIRLQSIESEKIEAKNSHAKLCQDIRGSHEQKAVDVRKEYLKADADFDIADAELTKLNTLVDTRSAEVQNYSEQIEKLRNQKPNSKPPVQDPKPCVMGCQPNCPECGASLIESVDHDEGDKRYDEYIKAFNTDKAIKLVDLQAKLDESKKLFEESKKDQQAKFTSREKAFEIKNKLKEKLDKQEADIEQTLKEALPEFDVQKFTDLKQRVNEKIIEIEFNVKPEIDKTLEVIKEYENKLSHYNDIISDHRFNKEIDQRNEELKEELRRLNITIEECEYELKKIEDFNRLKSDMLSDLINKKFKMVKWRLYVEQVNGGITDTCEAMVGGVPFNGELNYSKKIAAGIEIISVLSDHFGVKCPVFIDNRESVEVIPETNLQIINLYHSPRDKQLRVVMKQEDELVAA